MDLIINILLLSLGFVGAVIAIGGDTWEKGPQSLVRRITGRGWVAVISFALALALGVVKEVRSNTAANTLQAQLTDATSELNTATKKLNEMRRQLASAEPTILEAMYRLTERIVRESDFAFLSLRGKERESPTSSETNQNLVLYGGDQFEYHIFCRSGTFRVLNRASLVLEAGSQHYYLTEEHGVIRILGPIGQPLSAVIVNQERRSDCDLKIIIQSTDRTRVSGQFRDLLKNIRDAKAELANQP